MTKRELLHKIYTDDYLEQYFETALWATPEYDEEGNMLGNLDDNYHIDDFTFDALKEMEAPCVGFQSL